MVFYSVIDGWIVMSTMEKDIKRTADLFGIVCHVFRFNNLKV